MAKKKRVASGRVTHISAHSDGKHLNVSIKHGRKKSPKKGEPSYAFYDDRPETNLIVPKEHAADYHIGQRVDIAASPRQADNDDDEDGAGDAQDLDTLADTKSKAASGLFNATRRR